MKQKWSLKDLADFYQAPLRTIQHRAKVRPPPKPTSIVKRGLGSCKLYEKEDLVNWHINWKSKN